MARKGFIYLHPNKIRDFDFLKQYYVFFDEVTVSGAGVNDDELEIDYDHHFAKELKFLLEKKVIRNIENKLPDETELKEKALNNSTFSKVYQEKVAAENALKKSYDEPFEINDHIDNEGVLDLESLISSFGPIVKNVELQYVQEKVIAEYLSLNGKDEYTPLMFHHFKTGCISQSDTISLAISNFPTINQSVEWDRLCDFKNDNDTKLKLLRFRQFATKLSKEALTPNEVKEEIEWMLEEYKQHLKLAKMKFDLGKLEGIYLTSLKFVENLIKLKPSEAFGSLYIMKKNRIELLEAELNSPGKEVAILASLERL
jgi:hypothetical protein